MSSKRNIAIDVYRGMGILLVVLGHAVQRSFENYGEVWLFKLIYSFHMPMFVFASGLAIGLVREKHFHLNWLKARTKRLLVPFLSWIPIEYFFGQFDFSGLEYRDYTVSFSDFLLNTLLKPGGAWFLFTIYQCMLMLYFANIFRPKVSLGYSVFFFTAGLMAIPIVYNGLGLLRLSKLLPFFVVGIYIKDVYCFIKQYKSIERAVVIFTISSSVFIFVFSFLHWPFVDGWPISILYEGSLSPVLDKLSGLATKVVVGFSGIVLFVTISKLFCRVISFSKFFSYIGIYSLEIYVLHRMFMGICWYTEWLGTLIRFSIALSVSIVLVVVFKTVDLETVNLLFFGRKHLRSKKTMEVVQ